MKFAKELDQDAVPEWRAKYLNYKAGKKAIKAVSRAINRANTTPSLGRRAEPPSHVTPTSFIHPDPRRSTQSRPPNGSSPTAHEDRNSLHLSPSSGRRWPVKPASDVVSVGPGDERSGLARSPESGMRYGSFAAAPPSRASDRNDWELPAPAIRVPSGTSAHSATSSPPLTRQALQRSASMMPTMQSGMASPATINLPPGGMSNTPQLTPRLTPRLRLARIFSTGSQLSRHASNNKVDIGMQSLDQVRSSERDFFAFLDKELDKIETFYKQKEDQASERLVVLREQLHEMRNRRTDEIAEAKRKREQEGHSSPSDDESGERSKDSSRDWIAPIKAKFLKPGPNSKALLKMTETPVMTGQKRPDDGREYVRRPYSSDVPYRTAKRKLKLALQEFYRSLELLKSYALMNRTAFRKLNKKYDKAVNARPPYRYMNEKVNKCWFVNSDILDGHIHTVEDLYARYFERGNRKIAAGKLRNLNKHPGDSSDSVFRSGVLIGCGAVFAVQGLIYGSELLFDSDLALREHTSYLMQIYGGYFLMLFLFTLFTLACRVWTRNKINYPFIFEFDPRNNLDWKQLAEFPSFFFALFGVFIWLNFSRLGAWHAMYLYYPIVLIGLTLLILFFPAPILHHKARRWFLYSHYRLFFAGLYPVEFRDFFLGDIWCSLTYAACNIELFFCVYANSWNDPSQCNSNHSRLLGFFGALPPIWRALQCIRRYHDTGNVFPHLVNCGKYTMTILAAICLSLYRIDGTQTTLSLFIVFGAVNAVYCSIWDIFMDFSLLQPHARNSFLRDITAIRPIWVYYVVMIVDPILRFSWIFYAIFTHNTQHNTIVSFLISFAEVIRRGMWTVFRVENEHCGNVAQYKASRDTPLPYRLETLVEEPGLEAAVGVPSPPQGEDAVSPLLAATSARTTGADIPGSDTIAPGSMAMPPNQADEAQPEEGSGTFRRRRADTLGRKSILRVMAEAHKQDFEKRRPTEDVKGKVLTEPEDELHSEEEDDEDEDSGSLQEERMQIREAETLLKRGTPGRDDDADDDGRE